MKIDTSKIEGYAEMSAEDKIKVLEAYEMKDESADKEAEKYKTLISKANSEAAEWKRKFNEKLTEQEKADLEKKEADTKLNEELTELRRYKTVSSYITSYIGLGYDAELAKATAEALADNKLDVVLANQKLHQDKMIEEHKKTELKNQPDLTKSDPPKKTGEDEEFKKLLHYAGL